MKNDKNPYVCPSEFSGSLDNSIRRWIQNPQKILKPYIKKGMTVLDLGCGPGFFTVDIAKMLSDSGKVVAADLQEGMLEKVARKIKGTSYEQRVELHKCQINRIGINEKIGRPRRSIYAALTTPRRRRQRAASSVAEACLSGANSRHGCG